MHRIRIVFEKKDWFTFVNHMDLPNIFSRAARRAGLLSEYTQGFSPHPRISLGPALAISVEGREEPAEFWFEEWHDNSLQLWNDQLPEGLLILKCVEIEDGGPSLAKFTTAAQYRIRGVSKQLTEEDFNLLKNTVEQTAPLWYAKKTDGIITLIAGELNKCGGTLFVRTLKESGVISGWSDLYIIREKVGTWDEAGQQLLPLV